MSALCKHHGRTDCGVNKALFHSKKCKIKSAKSSQTVAQKKNFYCVFIVVFSNTVSAKLLTKATNQNPDASLQFDSVCSVRQPFDLQRP